AWLRSYARRNPGQPRAPDRKLCLGDCPYLYVITEWVQQAHAFRGRKLAMASTDIDSLTESGCGDSDLT
ncbi:MAG: hypothetical protein MK524_01130, partial [SAR202 cluster bacterium]|nr:hypothetical protein [SAR202 cluster bacterium]